MLEVSFKDPGNGKKQQHIFQPCLMIEGYSQSSTWRGNNQTCFATLIFRIVQIWIFDPRHHNLYLKSFMLINLAKPPENNSNFKYLFCSIHVKFGVIFVHYFWMDFPYKKKQQQKRQLHRPEPAERLNSRCAIFSASGLSCAFFRAWQPLWTRDNVSVVHSYNKYANMYIPMKR